MSISHWGIFPGYGVLVGAAGLAWVPCSFDEWAVMAYPNLCGRRGGNCQCTSVEECACQRG